MPNLAAENKNKGATESSPLMSQELFQVKQLQMLKEKERQSQAGSKIGSKRIKQNLISNASSIGSGGDHWGSNGGLEIVGNSQKTYLGMPVESNSHLASDQH